MSEQSQVLHPSHAKPGLQPNPAKLYVITMVSNPLRWNSRNWNYHTFQNHMAHSGAELHTAEIAFGNRPFEVTSPSNPNHLQLRSKDELWLKENALNLLMQHLPSEWEYVAWIDADVIFTRPDWAQETLHALQHYDFIQPFSHAQNLGPNSEPLMLGKGSVTTSFMYEYQRALLGELPSDVPPTNLGIVADSYEAGVYYAGHPGFAWAATKTAMNKVGGLIDWAICGSADYHMATSLVGDPGRSLGSVTNLSYDRWVQNWAQRAEENVKRNVGYVPGLINHMWHGPIKARNYNNRWQLLSRANFDPETDIYRDHQGLWQLSGKNILLRDGLRQYARLRNEDSTAV